MPVFSQRRSSAGTARRPALLHQLSWPARVAARPHPQCGGSSVLAMRQSFLQRTQAMPATSPRWSSQAPQPVPRQHLQAGCAAQPSSQVAPLHREPRPGQTSLRQPAAPAERRAGSPLPANSSLHGSPQERTRLTPAVQQLPPAPDTRWNLQSSPARLAGTCWGSSSFRAGCGEVGHWQGICLAAAPHAEALTHSGGLAGGPYLHPAWPQRCVLNRAVRNAGKAGFVGEAGRAARPYRVQAKHAAPPIAPLDAVAVAARAGPFAPAAGPAAGPAQGAIPGAGPSGLLQGHAAERTCI